MLQMQNILETGKSEHMKPFVNQCFHDNTITCWNNLTIELSISKSLEKLEVIVYI